MMNEGMFKGMFGRIAPDMCRLSMTGNIAVKTSDGYKCYNVKKNTLTNVTNFTMSNFGDGMFFVIPTTKAEVGDILLVDGHPKCVIENRNNKSLRVMDYENSSIIEIVPQRHIFMGATFFYGKIVSLFGSGNFIKGEKGINRAMKMMMMGEVMKSMNGNAGMGSGDNLFSAMMMMSMMGNMFGGEGKGEDFGDMFGFDFELGDEDEDDLLTEEDDSDDEETKELKEQLRKKLEAKRSATTKK